MERCLRKQKNRDRDSEEKDTALRINGMVPAEEGKSAGTFFH